MMKADSLSSLKHVHAISSVLPHYQGEIYSTLFRYHYHICSQL